MEKLSFFILGIALTSICFLVYLKVRKSKRRRKTINGYKLPRIEGGNHYQ